MGHPSRIKAVSTDFKNLCVIMRENTVLPYRVANDFFDFYGQPQGLSLRLVFSFCRGRCPHRPNIKFFIILLRRIGTLRTAFPTEKSLFFNKFSVSNKRREQAPPYLEPIIFSSSLFTQKSAFAEQLQSVIGGAYP